MGPARAGSLVSVAAAEKGPLESEWVAEKGVTGSGETITDQQVPVCKVITVRRGLNSTLSLC